jgi:hypothetical protein
MDYSSVLEPHGSLRPHIPAEISARPPRLGVVHRPVASFVAQYEKTEPEVPGIACVDPMETAADKLSAFSWRMIARDRSSEDDDPTIVRHLHDLAMLDDICASGPGFTALLRLTMEGDRERGGGAVVDLSPAERLALMNQMLVEDEMYRAEYGRFVEGTAFAGDEEVPSFDEAVAASARLSERLAA